MTISMSLLPCIHPIHVYVSVSLLPSPPPLLPPSSSPHTHVGSNTSMRQEVCHTKLKMKAYNNQETVVQSSTCLPISGT